MSGTLGQCSARRVEQQQYRVDVTDSKKEAATVQCHFARTRDLMFVLLPREVRLYPPVCACMVANAAASTMNICNTCFQQREVSSLPGCQHHSAVAAPARCCDSELQAW
jgi:hypothetical protein